MTTSPQDLLVDVRSPSEFATGALSSDIAPTVNVEYQIIDQLPEIYAARGIQVHKDDRITLYCRSGRRSNIALQTLKGMGYAHVRDIGGIDEARRVLDKEQVERQLAAEMGDIGEKEGKGSEVDGGKDDPKKHTRIKSLATLVDGLKDLEE
ncbi:Nn.00g063850.m01.CDS01 [Neocucurbitaria sp. VM-36]